jgi:hypothetical protein
MKRQTIETAVALAEAFIAAADAFKDREKTDEHFRQYVGICGFKETAAMKRASMELSRALTEVRRA